MVSTEEIYTPLPPAVGCLWVATKVFIVLVALSLFFLGLFAGIFVSVVANNLMERGHYSGWRRDRIGGDYCFVNEVMMGKA